MRILRAGWRWSWLVTLPVAAAFACWLYGTLTCYHAFGVRRIGGEWFTLRTVGALELGRMARHAELALTRTSAWPPPGVRTLDLFVPEPALKALGARLPRSGFEFVDGALSDGRGKVRRVKLRYRGDSAYHWAYEKKSWRIKTKREEPFDGMQGFNLIAPRTPEQLNNYLSWKLGELLGLITPKVEVVNVALNGRLSGLYVLTEQLDDATLRRHARVPGDVWVGDLIAHTLYRGVDNLLFEHPGLWEKAASTAPVDPKTRAPLDRLIDLVQAPRTERIEQELATLLDMDAFGRFAALEILCCTVHVDGYHNWRLYYDPARRCFVPIVWDLMGWHAAALPEAGARLDVLSSPLHVALHENGAFLRARHAALREFFASGKAQRFLAEVERTIALLLPSVAKDPNVVVLSETIRPAAVEAAMRKLARDIANGFAAVQQAYLGAGPAPQWAPTAETSLALTVSTRAPTDGLVLRFADPLTPPVHAYVSHARGADRLSTDVSDALVARGAVLEVNVPLLADFVPQVASMDVLELHRNRIEIAPGRYELGLEGAPPVARLQSVEYRRGAVLEPATRVERLEPRAFAATRLAVPGGPSLTPTVWQGDVTVDGVRSIDGELVLRAGTTVRMRAKATLLVRGRLCAEGTAQQPVRFVPAESTQPWGAVALQGAACNGSRLVHCELAGGSGHADGGGAFRGMLTVHDAAGVEIADCAFSAGQRAEALVHCAYGDVRFVRCAFAEARADALALDLCRAVVDDCRFTDVGDDGIALLTSQALITGCVLERAAGRGIAAAGAARLLVLDCRLARCGIGVQSEGSAVAVLANCDLEQAKVALDARKRDWRHGDTSTLEAYKCRLMRNDSAMRTDRDSHIELHDSGVDGPVVNDGKRIALDATVDARTTPDAASPHPLPAPQALAQLPAEHRDAWSRVDARRRGSSRHGQ